MLMQQRIGGKLFQEDQLREGFGMLTKVLGGDWGRFS